MSPKVKYGLIVFGVLVVLGGIFGDKDKNKSSNTETAIAQNKYIEEFNRIKKVSIVAVNGTKFNLTITKSNNIFKLHMDTEHIQKMIDLDKSAKVKLDKNDNVVSIGYYDNNIKGQLLQNGKIVRESDNIGYAFDTLDEAKEFYVFLEYIKNNYEKVPK